MKSKLKFITISIVVLFSIITMMGLLLPSKAIVSRAVNINANIDTIYSKINNLDSWKTWMKGVEKMQVTSPSVGTIKSTTITIVANTKNAVKSTWIDNKGTKQEVQINLIANDKITIVQWQFEEQFAWYPWQRLSSLMNEKMLGPVMEESLNALKQNVE